VVLLYSNTPGDIKIILFVRSGPLHYLNSISLYRIQPLFCVTDYRDNFSRLKNLILIGGPDDGVITPWQSRLAGIL
jgi:hypothetical protein